MKKKTKVEEDISDILLDNVLLAKALDDVRVKLEYVYESVRDDIDSEADQRFVEINDVINGVLNRNIEFV